MDRLQCLMTVKVTIQCTAHPPVKRTGNFGYVGLSDISQMQNMDEISITLRLKQYY
ncbi:hypothetical protein [Acinetobacter venetianus]|uniref:hypothetical protein n=1 Tax=Acinetobacter venetianus TaxID=52133 RepID=UPI0002DDE199|nr:hypothetical protein [Acinetobacter venetianus]